MHDLTAAQDIINTAMQVAKRNKLKKISKIVVGLGKIIAHNEQSKPKNLLFNFNLVKKDTIAEKAELVIEKGKGKDLTIIEVEGEK